MEAYQAQKNESKIEREDKIITIRTDDVLETSYLYIYKDKYRKPTLKTMRDYRRKTERQKIQKQVKLILLYFDNWPYIVSNNNLSEYDQHELIRAIYECIKLEIAFNPKRTSQILNYICMYHFKTKEFIELIENDINEINGLSFANIEFIRILKENIKSSNSLLNSSVILSIIMCSDFNLIKRGNLEILESYKQRLNYEIIRSNEEANKIVKLKLNLKSIMKKTNILETKKKICSGLLALTLLGSSGALASKIIASEKSTYAIETQIFTSLGKESNEINYSSIEPIILKTLEVYNEAYMENGELYRTIDTYDLTGTTSTSNEEYYSLDLTSLPILETKTIPLEDDDIPNSYKAISELKVRKRSLGEIGFVSFLSFCVLETTVLIVPFNLGKIYIDNKNDKLGVLYSEYQELMQDLILNINTCKEFLEKNTQTLYRLLVLCEEIIHSCDISELSFEDKSTINAYEDIRKRCLEIQSILNDEELDKYVKKYMKK